jgi:hypothetical protein
MVEARSAADLQGAVHSLLRGAGLLTERQELTMLFVAAALLLLALGAVLSRRRRSAPGMRWRPLSTLRQWAPPAALLLAAGGIAAAWVLWQPTSSPAATAEPSPAIARQAQHTPPSPPAHRPALPSRRTRSPSIPPPAATARSSSRRPCSCSATASSPSNAGPRLDPSTGPSPSTSPPASSAGPARSAPGHPPSFSVEVANVTSRSTCPCSNARPDAPACQSRS